MTVCREGVCVKCQEDIRWFGAWIDKPACGHCGWRETPTELRKLDDEQLRFSGVSSGITPAYLARVGARVTLAEAAEKSGVALVILSGIEHGRYPPSQKLLRFLSRLYGKTIRMETS